ncbi:formimidoylglutamase [Flavobacterium selenitireducens]|uniref:formimidoylglutamase n=1 Tax=Flavobacterium selenitireducens TaxID=2722704 RepID=UPI00168A90E5|nr:formimidoylglutamase [Flavobacterium selenitireducens]MBD3583325.1 formimidoylglutamase [Flavobacterium selenitireducens]
MEFDFLSPVEEEVLDFVGKFSSQHLGSKVTFHSRKDFPDLDKIRIAIIGVYENRGSGSVQAETDLFHFRKELYSLFPGNWGVSIADLGNIHAGESASDTYYALQKACAGLLKRRIMPIVIGGSQDLTYPMYRAYDELEQMVNLTAIDSRFDFGKGDQDAAPAHSYLSKIIVDEPNNLFNYGNLGYQTYYNSQEEIDLIDKLFFEAYRLGEISNHIALAEPVLRDTDLVSLDLMAVKSSASGNMAHFVPNGFDGKEICALARYAGISDKVSSFGLFGHHGSRHEAPLMAQVIWYFIEGVQYRSNEYPFGSRESYLKYTVASEGEEIVFYKSDKTDRWWIEIPFVATLNNKLRRSTLLPCSYEEYLCACNQEMPERWWKAQRRNIV